jgi:peptidoglycan/xylan/chitin deacetylase (PgdA/CDA1 family)
MSLRSSVLNATYAILRYSPVQVAFRRRSAERLAVLSYHEVADAEVFDTQLAYLALRARPVSLDDLLDALRRGTALPRRAVLLTFDDADPSHLGIAAPLLHTRGIPAVAFVVTALLDTQEHFWFEEVSALVAAGATVEAGGSALLPAGLSPAGALERLKRLSDAERRTTIARLRAAAAAAGIALLPRAQLRAADLPLLESAGIAIGSHTHSHACLDRCDEATVRAEVGTAHARLTEILGHEPSAFAYPGGYLDARVVAAVREAGYPLAFAYDDHLSPWPPPDPLRVSRVRGNAHDGLHRLALSLSGLHSAGWHAATRVRSADKLL